ncbi:HalOD1 output domain-containing protein [Natrialbaceae archaeon A-CW3]
MGAKDSIDESPVEDRQQFEYRMNDHETVAEAVLNVVGVATNTPILPADVSTDEDNESLPLLYDAIDANALDRLSTDSGDANADWEVTFTYAGCEVTVTSTDTVRVTDRSTGEGSGDC